ncbi:1822_t:CDS:2, partial [Funneliformis geosporum]
NHQWCEASVQILWRKIQSLNTLITCLPYESKVILKNNFKLNFKIPIFQLCNIYQILSDIDISNTVERLLKYTRKGNENRRNVATREVFQMLMKQTSLKELTIYSGTIQEPSLPFTDSLNLSNLSKLYCSSDTYLELFHQLSLICHNLQSLGIFFKSSVLDGLTDLMSVQRRLKYQQRCPLPLSFISKLYNLQELSLSLYNRKGLEVFQHAFLPQLQVLKFQCQQPVNEHLNSFLENSGKNLTILDFLEERALLEIVVEFSPKKFY